jgi:hypothetical protein
MPGYLRVVGDPADPMTVRRAEVFKPLGLELSARIEAATGPVPASGLAAPPPRPLANVKHCGRSG